MHPFWEDRSVEGDTTGRSRGGTQGALLGADWQAIARVYNHAKQSCKQAGEHYKATLCVI